MSTRTSSRGNGRCHAYLSVMIVNVRVTIVQSHQDPRLSRMQIHAFHSIRSNGQLALDIETQRLKKRPAMRNDEAFKLRFSSPWLIDR